jgi:hypothetical protein
MSQFEGKQETRVASSTPRSEHFQIDPLQFTVDELSQ